MKDDFTETEYCECLKLALKSLTFISFPEAMTTTDSGLVLLRHDLDSSLERALRLAQIESELGISSTYFVLLHTPFYNPLELTQSLILREIRKLGHRFGLHFDPTYSNETGQSDFILAIEREKAIIEEIVQQPLEAVSLHNPDEETLCSFTKNHVAGLINTYGELLRSKFDYLSDSNGYWRFRRLRDVLESGEVNRLQLLVHPEWWTPEPMSPRARMDRCIDGRAKAVGRWYDGMLEKAGRMNIR